MATVVLTWAHPEYARHRDTPGFVGFSQEYASPYGQDARNVSAADVRGMQRRDKNMDGFNHEFGVPHFTTCFRDPDDASSEQKRVEIGDLDEWTTEKGNLNLFQRPEIDFPNYQSQVLPEGVRGRHVRLVKVDTVFSKMYHNFETVHVDMSRIVDVDAGFHSTDCRTRPQELVLYSDGVAKVESHGYGTIIGPVRDSECEVGIVGFRHVPRLGMAWAGLTTGNDVCLAASGIENMVGQAYNNSLKGHTNGHLLFVSLVLELV